MGTRLIKIKIPFRQQAAWIGKRTIIVSGAIFISSKTSDFRTGNAGDAAPGAAGRAGSWRHDPF